MFEQKPWICYSLKSRGLTAWLWLFKNASQPPWSRQNGPAWPGSRPQAGPCTGLDASGNVDNLDITTGSEEKVRKGEFKLKQPKTGAAAARGGAGTRLLVREKWKIWDAYLFRRSTEHQVLFEWRRWLDHSSFHTFSESYLQSLVDLL